MTQIGEFFVTLGIKGSEKTIGALSNVKKGLGDVASTSLAVKAAVVGAAYALERLMSHSAQFGTKISNFSTNTGAATKQLQQWDYAAQQAGATAGEFLGQYDAVFNKIGQMKLNKGAPEYAGLLNQVVGFDTKKAYDEANGVFYTFQKLQQFAQSKAVPKDIINQVLGSFGVNNENIKAGLFKGTFNEANFRKAPIYSDKEINSLDRLNVALKNVGNLFEKAFGRFFAKHGKELVDGLEKIIVPLFKLIDGFTQIIEKIGAFKLITEAFQGWAIALKAAADAFEKLSPAVDPKQKAKDDATLDKFSDTMDKLSVGDQLQLFFKGLFGGKEDPEFFKQKGIQPLQNSITPKVPLVGPQGNQSTQNVEVNQNLYFQHEGKEHSQIKESTQQSVTHAWKQLYAQSQGA